MAIPAMDYEILTVTFTDGLENKAKTSHYITMGAVVGDAPVIAYYDKIAAISNCAAETVSLAYRGTDPTVAGSNAQAYITAADKADFFFQGADNATVKISVPGPKDTVFQSDKKTVNPANAAVAEFIVAVLALIVTKGGALLVEYLKGKREEGKPAPTKAGVVLHTP